MYLFRYWQFHPEQVAKAMVLHLGPCLFFFFFPAKISNLICLWVIWAHVLASNIWGLPISLSSPAFFPPHLVRTRVLPVQHVILVHRPIIKAFFSHASGPKCTIPIRNVSAVDYAVPIQQHHCLWTLWDDLDLLHTGSAPSCDLWLVWFLPLTGFYLQRSEVSWRNSWSS